MPLKQSITKNPDVLKCKYGPIFHCNLQKFEDVTVQISEHYAQYIIYSNKNTQFSGYQYIQYKYFAKLTKQSIFVFGQVAYSNLAYNASIYI